MRILIIGGGGREHALAWKLRREAPDAELIAAPGNPGIAELAECVPVPATDLDGLERLALDRGVELTIIGPEAPLALGIVDRFRSAGLPVFGPTRAAAEIETSKAFAKQMMLEAGVPTARAEMHTSPAEAKAAAHRFGAPVVVKASGLAAGKGVVVCQTLAEAEHAIDDMLEGHRFGAAGAEVLVEEFMEGEELSLFVITDGRSFVPLPALQDHKRLFDGDAGPNTGGMGAYVPVTLGDPRRPGEAVDADAAVAIVIPTLREMARRGRPFEGLLYVGLMITRDGPKVVEFNCRFGDPETQALMPVLDAVPLLPMMTAVAHRRALCGWPIDDAADREIALELGSSVDGMAHLPVSGACITTVLAAANYPETPRLGDPITLPPPEERVTVFHAGTARDAQGRLVTAGGRVLAVSAVASTIEAAQQKSLAYAERVEFAGKQLRRDIGWREIARQRPAHARAARD
jgi:phosphoribosylamine--glycine ligase